MKTEEKAQDVLYFTNGSSSEKFKGNDNKGNPKSIYLEKIIAYTDEELLIEAENKIWLSSFASNNPRSDFHWQTDGLYQECQRRGNPEIYNQAYKMASTT